MSAAADDVQGLETIAVCAPDNAGRMIGKRIPARRWAEVREHGLWMPNFHLITAIDNHPIEGLAVTGLHRGYPNGLLRPTGCLYPLAWEPGTALALCDVQDADGRAVAEAPRAVLHRQVERLAERGMRAWCATELEFYLFRTSYAQAHRKGYRALKPAWHRHADNDILIAGYEEPFLRGVRSALAAMAVGVEASQGEGGAGHHEVNLAPAGPLEMADRHVVFKHTVKALAHARGDSATFMAKVADDEDGSGCHVHLSLEDHRGAPAIAAANGELTPAGAAFLAGLLRYAPDFTLLHAPYANSYRRLAPGTFAPVNATWGRDNRTCLVRTVGRRADLRYEFRLPGADVNPYLCLAATLAAGVEGMDRSLEPPPAVTGDACAHEAVELPHDLAEGLAAFETSSVARAALGEPVHQHLALLARHERDLARRSVTDWDLRRYFENA
jgi:glutamine synthetase